MVMEMVTATIRVCVPSAVVEAVQIQNDRKKVPFVRLKARAASARDEGDGDGDGPGVVARHHSLHALRSPKLDPQRSHENG